MASSDSTSVIGNMSMVEIGLKQILKILEYLLKILVLE